ncbi:sensor histidine kinase [Paenibacillus thalictri]|uniref:histidine kinase n=1 Tax=Paenibacillus thalictri TaxID=2527873 RepID=A0A4Q9DWE6_9BACL|nr:HAMP domain-containing sensor histidine kinase [Paenibacillus thalictri]TBL80665.1 HAMP domain-containing histidine kinase [Paenibacillus thalictri]
MKRRFHFNLNIKFSLLLAVLLLFTVSVLSMLVLRGIRENQRAGLEREMAELTGRAEMTVKTSYLTGEPIALKQFMKNRGMELAYKLGQASGLHIKLYDETGTEIGNSMPMVTSPEFSDARQYALQQKIAYVEMQDTLYYIAPLLVNHNMAGVVEFQKPIGELNDFYRQTQRLFMLFGAAVLTVSFIIGFLYVHRQSKAIVALNHAAGEIGSGRYITHAPLKRSDELGTLSEGVYRMSREIESSIQALESEKAKLMAAVGKLKDLEQQQRQFINNVSHELKTPLTAILAYADLLALYGDDPALLWQAQENIHKEASRLYELVEKTLQLTKLETYAFEYQVEAVALDELLRDLCARLQAKAEKFGLTMRLSALAATVWAERESLIHIFVNLLDNAIKYNKPGGYVDVGLTASQDRAVIRIADTGIGIPEEARSRIFEPFYTVDKNRSRETGGTGLGLALVNEWVEKQRGRIILNRSDETGSEFEVTFPLYKNSSEDK